MYKLVVFDLDNTIAELGKGITTENIVLIKQLEQAGMHIAICSGKPIYYLCGFMRQVGLKCPILLGENGAVLQFGVDLPPRNFEIRRYSDEAKKAIALLQEEILNILPDIWFQPNQVGLTHFPKNEREFELIAECLERNKDKLKYLSVCRHNDSFDIMPAEFNKFTGVKYLGSLLNIAPKETVAVGDGANDYPMFEYAGYSVGVNVKSPDKVNVNFKTTIEALSHILAMTNN